MIPQELKNRIKQELEDDLDRHDGEYESWSETVFDCPSNDLAKLLKEVPDGCHDEIQEFMDEVVSDLNPDNE